jgi:hypothetical protein
MFDPSKVTDFYADVNSRETARCVLLSEFDNCAAALAEAREEVERLKGIVREYREQRGRYDHARDCKGPAECGVIDDDRCSTCKRADEVLGGK